MKHTSPKVWFCIFGYALLAGLAIQLVILPLIFPQLHAGNGLLAGRDWVGFHEQAVVHAGEVVADGWSAFRLRPDGDNAIIGVAAFFYLLITPEPWVLLPLNAAVFATGGLALFSLLRRIGLDDGDAFLALTPYLFFPSALLQYGQIHKDVFCTASLLVVLWSWVGFLQRGRSPARVALFFAACTVALIVLSIFRPYFMFPLLSLGALLLLGYFLWTLTIAIRLTIQKTERLELRAGLISNLNSIFLLILINLTVLLMSVSFWDLKMISISSDRQFTRMVIPVLIWKSNEDVRSADALRVVSAEEAERLNAEAARIKAVQECRPIVVLKENAFIENTINRAFLKIAVARAGFTSSGGTTAASNIDKNLDFCKNEDLIRYIPRALQIAFFAPFPSTWVAVEKRNSSAVEIYISAVEMFYCYIAYIGLLYWLFSYRRWNVALVVPVAFSLGLMLLLGLTVANIGTLYRMRFPFAMIFAGIGMAGILQLCKMRPAWLASAERRW